MDDGDSRQFRVKAMEVHFRKYHGMGNDYLVVDL